MLDPAKDPVAAIVLAAGRSLRMGRPKAFLPLGTEETFLRRIISTLDRAGASPLIVVGLPEWTTASAGLPEYTHFVANPDPDRGQLSSLQCGLAALPATCRTVLFTLVDVPLVTVETVAALISAHRQHGGDVVRPARAGRHGHPVLLTGPVALDLLAADLSQTTRTVLRRYAASTIDVPVADEGAFLDVDTPEEYQRLTRGLPGSPVVGPA